MAHSEGCCVDVVAAVGAQTVAARRARGGTRVGGRLSRRPPVRRAPRCTRSRSARQDAGCRRREDAARNVAKQSGLGGMLLGKDDVLGLKGNDSVVPRPLTAYVTTGRTVLPVKSRAFT